MHEQSKPVHSMLRDHGNHMSICGKKLGGPHDGLEPPTLVLTNFAVHVLDMGPTSRLKAIQKSLLIWL